MKDLENIEKLLKESFDTFEADAPADAWANIQKGIQSANPSSKTTGTSSSGLLKIVAIASITGAILTGAWYITKKDNAPLINKEETSSVTLTEDKPEIGNKEQSNIVSEEKSNTLPAKENEPNGSYSNNPVRNLGDLTEWTGTKTNPAATDKSHATPIKTEKEKPVAPNKNNEAENESPSTTLMEESPSSTNDVGGPTLGEATEFNLTTSAYLHPIANVFTPNGDGINDKFTITGENILYLHVLILDRSGKKLYEWETIEGAWDGKDMMNANLPSGTYLYVVDVKGMDGKLNQSKGFVTLNR